METSYRFCKDCRFVVVPTDGDVEFSKCSHPKMGRNRTETFLVTGKPETVNEKLFYHCSTNRGINGDCGPEGRHFEPASVIEG